MHISRETILEVRLGSIDEIENPKCGLPGDWQRYRILIFLRISSFFRL